MVKSHDVCRLDNLWLKLVFTPPDTGFSYRVSCLGLRVVFVAVEDYGADPIAQEASWDHSR